MDFGGVVLTEREVLGGKLILMVMSQMTAETFPSHREKGRQDARGLLREV